MDIINWLLSELGKHPFLKEHYSNLIEIKVFLEGEILFEDAWISKIHYFFETADGIEEFEDLEELERLMWYLEYKNSKVYDFETEEFWDEVNKVRKILHPLSNHQEDYKQMFMDYYIDHIHDYATGEIKPFSIVKK